MFWAAKWLPVCCQLRLPIAICRKHLSMAIITCCSEPSEHIHEAVYNLLAPFLAELQASFRALVILQQDKKHVCHDKHIRTLYLDWVSIWRHQNQLLHLPVLWLWSLILTILSQATTITDLILVLHHLFKIFLAFHFYELKNGGKGNIFISAYLTLYWWLTDRTGGLPHADVQNLHARLDREQQDLPAHDSPLPSLPWDELSRHKPNVTSFRHSYLQRYYFLFNCLRERPRPYISYSRMMAA